MSVIRIGKARIKQGKSTTRMEADITWGGKEESVHETLFYEVNNCWGKYLTPELSDCFVLSIVEFAIENGFDIEFDTPMSEDLKYQLETYFIPVYVKKAPVKSELKEFKLIGETTENRINSINAVGSGFSGGVDSFYTVLKHVNCKYKTKKITHLLLAVNGAANTGINAQIDKKWFDEELSRFQPLAEEMGLKLIGVNSNSSLINRYRKKIKGGSVISTAGFVHALRKLFGTFYWASGYEADILEFRTDDPCYVEPFSVPLLSVDGLHFYHSGSEASRMEKVKFIADNHIVKRSLTVCGDPDNCGVCSKCTRTMIELYLLEKLDEYDMVFPNVDTYRKHFPRMLGRELAQDHPPFTTEIIHMMHEKKMRIPFRSYLWSYLYFRPFFFLKRKMRSNKYIAKIYYEGGWIERLGEHKPQEDIIIARLNGERSEK